MKARNKGSRVGWMDSQDAVFEERLMTVLKWLASLLNKRFDKGVIHTDWHAACKVPLYKGQSAENECSNVGKLTSTGLIKSVKD